ncbi:recombinase family protein [Ruminococcaceae bacterium OttesenSCG-928-O06]|nr:recombinase family protein [Ruminococcaceae bacterium OttesenSCG-928-O06]
MNGVFYLRYSDSNQREESIEGQLRECQAYAEKNGITMLGSYIDRAFSAKTDNRPEFQRMMKDSGKRLFDVVIVWKLDRFARNRYDSAHNKALLRKNGVKVISATENISEGSDGILLESVLEGYAEYFSAELSEKVIRGMKENAYKCQWNGGGIPVGYVIDESKHYQIDPLTAPHVLDAFKKYDKGSTIREIEIWLNEKGVQSWRKKPIRFDAVNRMLKNRIYIGEYHFRDVVVPNGVPVIVPEDLFERVQKQMTKNKKAPSRHKAEDDYLLTTKLFCGKCGSFMVGECGTSNTGATYRYYKCVSVKKRRGCDKKSVKKEWIENLVVDEAIQMLFNDKLVEGIVDRVMDLQKKENTTIPLLRQQLAEAEKAIANMLNAIQQGVLTSSTKTRLEELEQTKSELEVAIIQEEIQKPTLTREFVTFFIQRFRNTDVTDREQRQRLIDSFINAIYLYDDKVVLTFNYKEESKTITLKDVEQAFGSDLEALGVPRKIPHLSAGLFLGILFKWIRTSAGSARVCAQRGTRHPVGRTIRCIAKKHCAKVRAFLQKQRTSAQADATISTSTARSLYS